MGDFNFPRFGIVCLANKNIYGLMCLLEDDKLVTFCNQYHSVGWFGSKGYFEQLIGLVWFDCLGSVGLIQHGW